MKPSSLLLCVLLPCVFATAAVAEQGDDIRALRLKLSGGDLPSAESILEVHRTEKGEDGEYLWGLAWLARGAALVSDWKAASSYARQAREIALPKLRTPADYEVNREAAYALGTAIEVDAQALAAMGKKSDALRFLERNLKTQVDAPFNLRARIWKRWNQIGLEGTDAPGFQIEDHVGSAVDAIDKLRGKPVVLFLWAEWCGDCKAQATTFRRAVEKYAPRGVVFMAPTRFYTKDHVAEKERVEKIWKEVYATPPPVGVPISDEAMLRYGVSGTPTFAFVNRKGLVTLYSPTRMTEERLSAAIEDLLH